MADAYKRQVESCTQLFEWKYYVLQHRARVCSLTFRPELASVFRALIAADMKAKIKRQGEKWRNSVDTLRLPQNVFNVVVLGAGGVGKTSLIMRFINNAFSEQYNPTVEDMYEKPIHLRKGVSAFLQVLDTAGSYQFPAMKRVTLQYGEAFIIVYSVDSASSLEEALKLQQEIYDAKGTDDVPMVLVGNKCDLASGSDQRRLTRVTAATQSRGKNCVLAETSAKYNVNVSAVFTALIAQTALANCRISSSESSRSKYKQPNCVIS